MPVVAEHRQEAGVPEEDVLVEGGVDELADETAARLGLVEVAEPQLPGLPVHLDVQRVLVVDRAGQLALGLGERRQRFRDVLLLGEVHPLGRLGVQRLQGRAGKQGRCGGKEEDGTDGVIFHAGASVSLNSKRPRWAGHHVSMVAGGAQDWPLSHRLAHPISRFFRLFRRPARAAEKPKKPRTAIGGWPVVANPALRWGKPSGGGKVSTV